jgi:transposase
VRYLVRSGCGWRMLPIHFGPWQTVYAWFRELARRFLFQTISNPLKSLAGRTWKWNPPGYSRFTPKEYYAK